jgi:hypothetical protein
VEYGPFAAADPVFSEEAADYPWTLFTRNPQHFRNLDGFYHNPIINNMA